MILREDTRQMLLRLLAPKSTLSPTDWCAKNVVFGQSYPTSDAGRFNPNRFPFWREVLDHVADKGRREIVIWKCSQAGGTEGVLQNALRWAAVNEPAPMLWVGAQQEFMVGFWEGRILPGLTNCGLTLVEALQGWTNTAQMFRAPNGTSLYGTWASSRSGLKSRSYQMVFCDEVSTYESWALEKIRPRVAHFPNSKIFILSALDHRRLGPTSDDPLFKEWDSTDKREWIMADPAGGGTFTFEMGWRADKGEQRSGLKWAPEARREDGSWDLDMVAATARYWTPGGAQLDNDARLALLRTGRWEPTAMGREGAFGYRVNCFMLPHRSLGEIAVGFLRAKKAGVHSLRTFIMEELAEKWHEERITIGDTQLDKHRAEYAQWENMSDARAYVTQYMQSDPKNPTGPHIKQRSMVLVSGDVQKKTIYFLAREWMPDGSSGLVGWDEVVEWGAYEDLAQKVKGEKVYIDAGYKQRIGEVVEYAAGWPGVIPCYGRDARMKFLYRVGRINADEGTAQQRNGRQIFVLTWDTWAIKWHLFQLIMGREGFPAWRIPRDVSREYIKQVSAEEFVDGRVVERVKGADNHLLDCEALQVLGAVERRILSPFKKTFLIPESSNLGNPEQMGLFGRR